MRYTPYSQGFPLHRLRRARRGGWIVARYLWPSGRMVAHVPTRAAGLDLIDQWTRGGAQSC